MSLSPPPVETKRSSLSGMFHSLKKSLGSSSNDRPDVEFLDAKTRFEQYHDTLFKLKGNMQNYLNHATQLWISSSQCAQDFATLIEDPEAKQQTPHTPTVQSSRQQHSTLTSDHIPPLNSSFTTQIFKELDEEIQRTQELQKRIARRIELFSECGYYQKKVEELKEDKAKRAGKGKAESASDIEKLDRNVKKLEEVTAAYTDANKKLMEDLTSLWERDRQARLGPIMQLFIQQEKKVANAYSEALKQIKTL